MRNRHVTHLLTRHVHGQLRPAVRARVINHVRDCPTCRAALAREERLVADVRREMPQIGQPCAGQMAQVWAGVWQEIGSQGTRRPRSGGIGWLPGLSMALAVLLLLAVALPLLAQNDSRVEAALVQQPRPNLNTATASPVPGITDEAPPVSETGVQRVEPRATVAFAVSVGASPVPEPGTTVSPVAQSGVYGRWEP